MHPVLLTIAQVAKGRLKDFNPDAFANTFGAFATVRLASPGLVDAIEVVERVA